MLNFSVFLFSQNRSFFFVFIPRRDVEKYKGKTTHALPIANESSGGVVFYFPFDFLFVCYYYVSNVFFFVMHATGYPIIIIIIIIAMVLLVIVYCNNGTESKEDLW